MFICCFSFSRFLVNKRISKKKKTHGAMLGGLRAFPSEKTADTFLSSYRTMLSYYGMHNIHHVRPFLERKGI